MGDMNLDGVLDSADVARFYEDYAAR